MTKHLFENLPETDPKKMETESQQLAEAIRYHNEKYWVEHKPEISDIEYDKLVERLRVLDPQNPVLIELVEDATRDFKKVKHDVPMLSIEKVFSAEEVIGWASEAGAFKGQSDADGIVAAYKVDGSSCSLIYDDGKLVRAASRGNGVLGDDITRNVKMIQDVPHSVSGLKGQRVEIRGEIYMSIASFKAAVTSFEAQLAAGEAREEDRPTNPRNYCAGSIKQKDPSITKQRNLSFMAHGVIGRLPGADGKSDVSNQQTLKKLGFKSAFYQHVRTAEEVSKAIAGIEAERKDLPYEIDGVVFTINRLALHAELGATSHHPRYRLAFKFSRERGETTVKRIIWHTTRSGKVSPAMEVDPICLGGATVTLCTLHNAKTVKETGLCIGDKVLLEREVIPYFVQKTDGKHKEARLPSKCESCSSELEWDETQTNLVCANLGGCPSQLHDFLCHYVSRGVTNMMGIGEKLIAKLIDVGLLKSPADFYKLTEKDILENIERQGETSARNIITAISSRREQSLETFLVSLGIRGLGPSIASRLVAHFATLEAILSADVAKLNDVEGVAETLAETLRNGLHERQDLIQHLLKHVKLIAQEKVEGVLSGKSFCLTGHVEFDYDGKHYDARPDIEALIKSKGGTIKSVSKTLDYLVVGDEAGSKVEKAKKAGVKTIDPTALLKLLQ